MTKRRINRTITQRAFAAPSHHNPRSQKDPFVGMASGVRPIRSKIDGQLLLYKFTLPKDYKGEKPLDYLDYVVFQASQDGKGPCRVIAKGIFDAHWRPAN